MAKTRVDVRLVELGLVESRSKAQALIMAGSVYIGTKRVEKPGQNVTDDAQLSVKNKEHPWASRGGMKLAHAIEEFGLDLKNKVVLDIGASTGGFTDVALHHGALKVYAVDVGHGQLAWKLREDDRVIVLEKQNARYLTMAEIPDPVDVITCDASFIGLQTVLPASMALVQTGAVMAALIKPQFEVGKGQVGKKGVVKDPALHAAVCDRIEEWLNSQPGWSVRGITTSPITGPEGNIEFLIIGDYAG
ncbi:MAG: TlyA family RNA methyltransferase [Alphaproteobacteria bacterium]|nr:MAG: TlyA family RNA methyltransferase [Alphaproteobacteria bacterium]